MSLPYYLFRVYPIQNNKIVFYPFDLINYLSNRREMYFDYDELVVVHKIYSFDELLDMLEKNYIFYEAFPVIERNQIENDSELIVSFIKDKIGFK